MSENPWLYAISETNREGKESWHDGEQCVFADLESAQEEVDSLNDDYPEGDFPFKVVPLYRALALAEKPAERLADCQAGWIACSGDNPCSRHVGWWKEYNTRLPQPPAERPQLSAERPSEYPPLDPMQMPPSTVNGMTKEEMFERLEAVERTPAAPPVLQARDNQICNIVKELFYMLDWPVDSLEAQHLIHALTQFGREAERTAFEKAAQHWPIGELGTLPDFRCSCGATLLGTSQDERIAAWKEHVRALADSPVSGEEK